MRTTRILAAALAALVGLAAGGKTQKKQKKTPAPIVKMQVADQINRNIGEMLGAWQVGNVEAMHRYYANNATWVSGAYQPPIAGWQNYVAAYQQERKQIRGVQLVTRNMNIFHDGNVAWACYQWELYYSLTNGITTSARGQTTLVLVLTAGQWLIVHNHTSWICPAAASQASSPARPGD